MSFLIDYIREARASPEMWPCPRGPLWACPSLLHCPLGQSHLWQGFTPHLYTVTKHQLTCLCLIFFLISRQDIMDVSLAFQLKIVKTATHYLFHHFPSIILSFSCFLLPATASVITSRDRRIIFISAQYIQLDSGTSRGGSQMYPRLYLPAPTFSKSKQNETHFR